MCHRLSDDYFYFDFEGKRSFTHIVRNHRFILWIYHNNDDMRNINDDIKVTKDLAEEYKLGRKGWKTVPNVPKFMVLSIKLQRLSLVQSKKKDLLLTTFTPTFLKS